MSSMIISCPDCASRFNIDPDRIPSAGRQVRCGKCSHVWRIAADGGPIPATGESPPESERLDTGNPFGRPAPAGSQPPAGDSGPPPPAGDPPAGEGMNQTAGPDQAPGAEVPAGAASPIQGSVMTPNARQKLAAARKGRSRVRFLVIALVLMVVAAVAVSFIRQPDGLNDALRTIPGLNEGGPADIENTGTDSDPPPE